MRNDIINTGIELGKLPPQVIDMEKAVLGAVMLESSCVDNILVIIKPESFYTSEHQIIFRAIIDLKERNKRIDILTVTEQLRKSKELDLVGGPVYITSLTSNIASSSHAEGHARYIQDCFIKRELIRMSSELQTKSFDEFEDTEEILNEFTLQLNRLSNETVCENAELLKGLLSKRLKEVEEISKNPGMLIGVPSGFTKLDRITGGWQKTDLIIVAARPSMGKTSFAFNLAMNAVTMKKTVVFFSLEMSKMQLVDKSVAYATGLSPSQFRNGKIADHEWELIDYKLRGIEDVNLFIDDTPALTLMQLRSKITKLLKFKIDVVIIDYLQLMNAKTKGINRDQEIGLLTGGIKALSKETGIPFIVLSQLSREVEKRSDKRPQLSDLRESGNIEQDADIVTFLYRPEYYGITEDKDNNSLKGITEVIIAKHRNGAVGSVELYTNEYCSRFFNENIDQIEPLEKNLTNTNFYEKDEPPY